MGKLLSLVTGWKGYVGAAAIAAFLASLGTYKIMHNANLAAETIQAKKVVEVVERRGKITFDVGMNFEKVRLLDTQATDKRLEEVESHVTAKADSECPVTLGYVRVFNDAAHGPVPDASTGPDDSPSGVALSDVAKTTVQNFGQYDQVSEQLKGLQDWVRQQQAIK